jgi:hypothetical protein
MAEFSEFKRMNYFTGFFTTAEDWRAEQTYHREKLKLHNRGMHTPGVMRGVADELRVRAVSYMNIEILPGAAIDGEGNEIRLGQSRTLTVTAEVLVPRLVYVALAYHEEETDPIENVQRDGYSGKSRVTERPEVRIMDAPPDNVSFLELARIDLQPGVTAISDPADPQAPGGNEIDQRKVKDAGSIGIPCEDQWLTAELKARIDQHMDRTWSDFDALATRFPTPRSGDVRHAALTLQMLARIGFMRADQVLSLLQVLVKVEQVLGDELDALYPKLQELTEYEDYLEAMTLLLDALHEGNLDLALTRQDEVAEAASQLALLEIQKPAAHAGADQTVNTTETEAVVTLDARASQAFEGRDIRFYHWDEKLD